MYNPNFGGKAGNVLKTAGAAIGVGGAGAAATGGTGAVVAAAVAAAPYVAAVAAGAAIGYGIYKGIEWLSK